MEPVNECTPCPPGYEVIQTITEPVDLANPDFIVYRDPRIHIARAVGGGVNLRNSRASPIPSAPAASFHAPTQTTEATWGAHRPRPRTATGQMPMTPAPSESLSFTTFATSGLAQRSQSQPPAFSPQHTPARHTRPYHPASPHTPGVSTRGLAAGPSRLPARDRTFAIPRSRSSSLASSTSISSSSTHRRNRKIADRHASPAYLRPLASDSGSSVYSEHSTSPRSGSWVDLSAHTRSPPTHDSISASPSTMNLNPLFGLAGAFGRDAVHTTSTSFGSDLALASENSRLEAYRRTPCPFPSQQEPVSPSPTIELMLSRLALDDPEDGADVDADADAEPEPTATRPHSPLLDPTSTSTPLNRLQVPELVITSASVEDMDALDTVDNHWNPPKSRHLLFPQRSSGTGPVPSSHEPTEEDHSTCPPELAQDGESMAVSNLAVDEEDEPVTAVTSPSNPESIAPSDIQALALLSSAPSGSGSTPQVKETQRQSAVGYVHSIATFLWGGVTGSDCGSSGASGRNEEDIDLERGDRRDGTC